MDRIVQHEEVLREVEGLGLFQAPHLINHSKSGSAPVLEGQIVVEEYTVTVRLVLDPSFPNQLPRFFLEPWDALGFVPHVLPNGQICYLDSEGIVIDRRRPVAIVEDAFQRVLCTLAKGVTGKNRADFADEWEVYWRLLDGAAVGFSSIDPSPEEVGTIVVVSNRDGPFWFARDESEVADFYNGLDLTARLNRRYGLYLPLERDTWLIPPRPDQPFWTTQELRQIILDGLSKANRAQLRQLTKRRPRNSEYVIVSLPRPSGGATLFGIRFDEVHGPHPLRERGRANRVVPLVLQRCDRSYLAERGGGHAILGSKRILLVGCGAVGGHLAIELARAGICDLTVVDFETLALENTFRHALGRKYLGKSKAEALNEEIEALLPFVRVTPIVSTIEAALAADKVDLASYDLVVVALGTPTVELEINERIHALSRGPAAIFAWLEPLGIGGHTLLTGNGLNGGCFECLYTAVDTSEEYLTNRAAFAAPGQLFGRALSGCGSLYTPYGSMDAVQTANLAVRLAIRALIGDESGNPLLSWKGDPTSFEAANFRVSPRFSVSTQELWQQRYAYRTDRCSICGRHDRRAV